MDPDRNEDQSVILGEEEEEVEEEEEEDETLDRYENQGLILKDKKLFSGRR